MDKHIGITYQMLNHIIGVARKCYEIAKNEGHDEAFCKRMFMIGWNSNVGYEFSGIKDDVQKVSCEMLRDMVCVNKSGDTRVSMRTEHAIYYNGKYPAEDITYNAEWRILNMAEMLIDDNGKEISAMQKLDGIRNRYGEHSDRYLTACDICYRTGLTVINLASNIM